MAADDFFQRWAKHNAELHRAPAHEVQPPAAISAKHKTGTLPTLDDVAALMPESDYSPFVVRGVDQTVQRSALKKLFSDPHFNVMDGLDTYIDDYHKFEPIPPEMLALLNHAQDLLNPLAKFEKPIMQLIEAEPVAETETAPPVTQAEANASDAEDSPVLDNPAVLAPADPFSVPAVSSRPDSPDPRPDPA
ncbi:MAG TPA: DUF3306 domain-containing protein [Oxalobacteraceae bacterium]|jgi:hypothetical protein|nr:DUF3306 domain-containing protein [Oxalobacteraceae bacterium]